MIWTFSASSFTPFLSRLRATALDSETMSRKSEIVSAASFLEAIGQTASDLLQAARIGQTVSDQFVPGKRGRTAA